MQRTALARLLIQTGTLMIVGAALISCAPNTSAPTLQPRRTATSSPEPALATAQATQVTLAPFTDQACLKCHTDQQQLKALAVEDTPVKAESEGPG
jgi:cytochrome c5